MAMNKDIFWGMIETAKTAANGNLELLATNLKNQLLEMTIDDVIDFDNILSAYSAFAHKDGLWTIATVVKEYCSDDGFDDFCFWLIAQGKDAYFSVLRNVDNLADLTIVHDEIYGTAEFCDLRHVASSVYYIMTGADMLDQDFYYRYLAMKESLESDIEYMEGIDKYIETSDLLTQFPKIVAKYVGPDFI